MTRLRYVALASAVVGCLGWSALADPLKATVSVDVAHPGPTIGPMMYGLMTEEINHSYDGGLYAELIQNRSFKDAKAPSHWSAVGGATIELDRANPVNAALDVSLNVRAPAGGGVANEGYWGIPIKPDTVYSASFYVRGDGGFTGPLDVAIVDDQSKPVATGKTLSITDKWTKITVPLKTATGVKAAADGKFVISTDTAGSFSLSYVSLFPPTFNNRPNGSRIDLMEKMAAMKPAFIRLPGGNYVEGDNFPNRFDWKKMIGPADQRPGHMGCWSYRSSDGFGMIEFLDWCEDLHAEPLLAVFAGYTLNHDHVVAGPGMNQYVEEALEEIEYCTGDATTTWGKKRAEDGHPAPFTLHYVEIGNEDWFDRSGSYDGRYTQIHNAIRAKYPNLKLIATAPVKSVKPDLYDDHYYRSARDMAFDSGHYNPERRKAKAAHADGHTNGTVPEETKIFVGEWATQEGRPTPDLNAGLADAAWLMGLENDADLVQLTCYAPLLVNVNPGAWQWPTNLIGYNNSISFGSPSYHAQAMINQNRGDVVLPTKTTVAEAEKGKEPTPHGRIGVGTWHTEAEFKDIKVSPIGDEANAKPLLSADLTAGTGQWTTTGGTWSTKEGAIKPGSDRTSTWAVTGDPSWTDYVVTLKARKIAGNEGFLILFHAADAQNYLWWNLGGWGNTRTQFEATYDDGRGAFGPESNFKVETGRWYDVKLVVQGHHFMGYVDGKLITDATEKSTETRTPFFAQSSYDNKAGEVIFKVVNMSKEPVEAAVDLSGAQVLPAGKAIVLFGEPTDQNTLEAPDKIIPHEEQVSGIGSSFRRTFPPHSFTLMRIPAKAK